MNRKLNIEARLERSLRSQVRVPKLDGRFDAAVWARIEAAAAPAVRERSAASRWLFASNLVGIAVAIVLVGFFGWQSLSGVEVNVALPTVSPGLIERLVPAMIWPVTGIALAFGMMFTSTGRRLRAEFF